MSMTVGSVIVSPIVSAAEVWDEYYIAMHGAHNALRAAFTESGMTQEELAGRLGIDKALVSKRLNGAENLTIKTLSQMGTGLGYRLTVAYVPFHSCGVTNQYFVTPIHGLKSSTSGVSAIININTEEQLYTETGTNFSVVERQGIG
jgi:transcriptional regulator with XRE-family HTH domain